MNEVWKPLDVLVPSSLPVAVRKAYIHAEVLRQASEAGDFVARIDIGRTTDHSHGWHVSAVSYLPGPPGLFTG